MDILVCPELWRGDQGPDLFTELCARLGMKGLFVPLARGERVTSSAGGRTWLPLLAHFTGEHGLYFQEHRDLSKRQWIRRSSHGVLETGEWGLGLLTKSAHRGDSRRTARSPRQGEGKSSRHRRAALIGWPTVLRNGRARSAPESWLASSVSPAQRSRGLARASVAHDPRGRFQLLAPVTASLVAGLANARARADLARALSPQSDRPRPRTRSVVESRGFGD